MEFKNANKPEISEIEKSLDIINQENDIIKKLIDEEKNLDIPPLLFNKNNEMYKGMWNINIEKEGYGALIDKDGNKYVGGWKEDKFNGYGRIISKNGDYYEGEWVNGIIEGKGKYFNKEENFLYVGDFKNNKFNGKGKIVYNANNITYEGNFENGYKEGKGKIHMKMGHIMKVSLK